MQADLPSLIETIKGSLVHGDLIHDAVDVVYVGSDLNDLGDDLTNVLWVTNLVHSKVLEVAEEVDIVAVCYTNGHAPKQKDATRAKELELDVITTPLAIEEAYRLLKAEFGTTLEIKTKLPVQVL